MGGGGGNKKVLVSFVVLMFLGIAVYFRLWTIDYRVSSDETELIRRQFDLANREAMDESAEWRLKYDVEAERSTKCMNELKQIQGSLEEDGNAANINLKLVMLQKENVALAEQIEALKQELETEKLKCRLQYYLIMINIMQLLYTSKKLFPELAQSPFCKVTASIGYGRLGEGVYVDQISWKLSCLHKFAASSL